MAQDRIIKPLRAAIVATTASRYSIAKQAGLSESVLSRFVAGKSLTLETAERLAEVLELTLSRRAGGDSAIVVSIGPRRASSKRNRRREGSPVDEFSADLHDQFESVACLLADKYLPDIIPSDHIEYESTRDALIAEVHVSVGDLVSRFRRRLGTRARSAAKLDEFVGRTTVGAKQVERACKALNLGNPPAGEPVDEQMLKRHYREFAKKYHPDKNPGDEEAAAYFRDKTAAYELLCKYNDDVAARRSRRRR